MQILVRKPTEAEVELLSKKPTWECDYIEHI